MIENSILKPFTKSHKKLTVFCVGQERLFSVMHYASVKAERSVSDGMYLCGALGILYWLSCELHTPKFHIDQEMTGNEVMPQDLKHLCINLKQKIFIHSMQKKSLCMDSKHPLVLILNALFITQL